MNYQHAEMNNAAADEWVGDHSQMAGKSIDEDTLRRWRYLSNATAHHESVPLCYADAWPVIFARKT